MIRIPNITPTKSPSGSIFLRWRWQYKEYAFTLPLKWDNRRDRRKAEEIAEIIREDIKHDALGLHPPAFDGTLDKYRPGIKKIAPAPIPTLLQIWEKFSNHQILKGDIAESTIENSYSRSGKILEKVPTALLLPEKAENLYDYLSEKYAVSSLRTYYINFVGAANWAVKEKLWQVNPYKPHLRELNSLYKPDHGKAYSDSEATAIIEAIAKSNHAYYTGFVKFLFMTGVRPQLAIALEWEQIIWDEDRPIKIYFDRAHTRGILKPSKGDRKGKNTPRVFPVNAELAALIKNLPHYQTIHREPRISHHLKTVTRPHYPNLVFPTPVRHWYISIDDFTERIFRPIVESIVDAGKITEYLPTYHARHTTQNRWLESGMSEETIAALLDTSPEMIRKHYRNDQRYLEALAENLTIPPMSPD